MEDQVYSGYDETTANLWNNETYETMKSFKPTKSRNLVWKWNVSNHETEYENETYEF